MDPRLGFLSVGEALPVMEWRLSFNVRLVHTAKAPLQGETVSQRSLIIHTSIAPEC